MQNAAGGMEPFLFNRFPLAARPQYMPNAIQNIPIPNPWSTWLPIFWFFRQMLFQQLPQLARHTINVSRFCAILAHGDDTFRTGVVVNPVLTGFVSTFNYFSDTFLYVKPDK
jgi:hypothetical protein